MKNEFKTGIFFTALGQYGSVIIQLGLNIVLSRLLTPKDFGVFAIIQVLVLFFRILAGQSISPAIVQNKLLTNKDYGVIFNYSLIMGIVLAIFFGFFGNILSKLFDNQIYVSLSWMMSFLIIADSVNCVPNGILAKEKRFKEVNLRFLFSLIAGAIVGITSAFLGAGVYALIIFESIVTISTLVLNLFLVKIEFTKSLDLQPVKSIFFFVKHQTLFALIDYLYRNLDNLLIGIFLGATNLGNYSKGYQLTAFPISVLQSVINPVIQPILSEHERDYDLIRDTYLKITHTFAMLVVPISLFMFLNADKIIYFLFGNQWTQAIIPFAILSLSIWAQMLAQTISVFWQSRNLPHIQTCNGLLSFAIIGSAIVIGILTQSIIGVAYAVAISYIINFFVSATFLLYKGLGGKISQLINVLIQPFLLGVLLVAAMLISNPVLSFSSLFLTLLARGGLWLSCIAIFLVGTGEWSKFRMMMKK